MEKKTLEIINQFLQLEGIGDSRTNSKSNTLIQKYTKKLQRIASEVINNKNNVTLDRLKWGSRVNLIYHEVAQKSLINTFDFIEKTTGVYPIITTKDLMTIKERADRDSNRFWKMIEQREVNVQEAFSLAQILSFITSSLSGSVFGSIQSTTVSNLKLQDSNLDINNDDILRSRRYRSMWLTEDDSRVCPICFPLHGRIYELNDDIPQIPEDTHHNCRCRVVPIDENDRPLIG